LRLKVVRPKWPQFVGGFPLTPGLIFSARPIIPQEHNDRYRVTGCAQLFDDPADATVHALDHRHKLPCSGLPTPCLPPFPITRLVTTANPVLSS
jgi:hypothetical protein